MKPLTPMDAGFLLLEKRNQPMHVGGLMLLTPPKDAPEDYVEKLAERLAAATEAQPPFNQRLVRRMGLWFWDEDKEFDLEAHFRHLALPKPGRIRELLTLVSQLHSNLMDRSRPLWEFTLISGVEDGRIAVYSKIHHALVDGIAAMRMLQRAMSEDATEMETIPLWAMPPKKRGIRTRQKTGPFAMMAGAAAMMQEQASSLPAVGKEVFNSIRAARRHDPDYVSVFQAPESLFNQRITGSRRFAAQSWDLPRIKKAGKKHNATLNDVVLAMCGSALRKYLLELNALPAQPLIGMVPMSLRTDDSDSGNQVAAILANLGTDIDDPLQRLTKIKRSIQNAKDRFEGMSQLQILNYVSSTLAISGINMATGLMPEKQAFNVVISNVPGPKNTLYWNGAKLEGTYPVSIAMDGVALNITLNSYVDKLEFGLIACRRTVPHMQRLLQYLEEGLVELETA